MVRNHHGMASTHALYQVVGCTEGTRAARPGGLAHAQQEHDAIIYTP